MGGIKRLGLVHVLVNAVIYYGHIGTFEWVYMSGRANRVPERARMLASQQGDIIMLSCTKKLNVLNNGEILWHSAAKDGQIDVLDWLCDNGYEFTDDLPMTSGCSGFQKEVFSWASQRGIDWKKELLALTPRYMEIYLVCSGSVRTAVHGTVESFDWHDSVVMTISWSGQSTMAVPLNTRKRYCAVLM